MKRPAFQFYPADWRSNLKLRRCSEAARGAWVEILCVLHDSDEYGVFRFSLKDLAKTAGISQKSAKELVEKNVLKGGDISAADFIYTPRHAGKDGEPVLLVKAIENQPVWYCARFVKDEHVRQNRGKATQFSEENQPPKGQPKSTPKGGIGERQGDGSTSTSSSSVITSTTLGDTSPQTGDQPPLDLEKSYKQLDKTSKTIHLFIVTHRPAFIEPYFDLWNIFAAKNSKALMKSVNDARRKKLRTRTKEPAFNFSDILRKASASEFLLTKSFFGFDWIVENDTNYLKVLEGNFDNDKIVKNGPPTDDYMAERQKREERTRELSNK